MRDTFGISTTSVSDLGEAIAGEAQDQLHFDPANLDVLKTNLDGTVRQLPAPLMDTVQQFVSDFESNYTDLLNQRYIIGQILQKKVSPAAEEREMQLKDSFQ